MFTLSATTLARAAAAQLERLPPPSVIDRVKMFSPLAVMDRRPCGCLLLWMLLPLLAGVLVLPALHLTDPTVGWRVKHHPTASALDALVLATRETGVVGDAVPGASDDFGAATSSLLNAGEDCWDGCFGQPGVCGWCGGSAGACCMRSATGNLASEACGGPATGPSTVGCDGHHCCVDAISPPTPPSPPTSPPPMPPPASPLISCEGFFGDGASPLMVTSETTLDTEASPSGFSYTSLVVTSGATRRRPSAPTHS